MAQKQSLATKLEHGLSTQDIPLFLEVACQLINQSQDAQKAAAGWTCLLLFREESTFNAWVELNKGKCFTGTGKLFNVPNDIIDFKENALAGILTGKVKVTAAEASGSIKVSGKVSDVDRFTSLVNIILPALKDLHAPAPVPKTTSLPKTVSEPATKTEPVAKVETKPAAAVEVKTAPAPAKKPEKAVAKPSAKPALVAPPAEIPEKKQAPKAEAPETPISKGTEKPVKPAKAVKKAAKKGAKKAAKKPST